MYHNNIYLETPMSSFVVLSVHRNLTCWPGQNLFRKINFENCGDSQAYLAFRVEVVIDMV
jgi:hypothetical protein